MYISTSIIFSLCVNKHAKIILVHQLLLNNNDNNNTYNDNNINDNMVFNNKIMKIVHIWY
jgi:hypothetical protein